ncbi:hypothetical protein E4U43_000213 [Claviceps pusilla]|uniref:Carboxylesterase type B domain-containing protein n=1 Tax=Claviceps pusilla TaxID=123648 RepID=A0A9P7N9U0_9HYPO|nr:hypothetical protein E4U43_000213 [Claviceps pusilla]
MSPSILTPHAHLFPGQHDGLFRAAIGPSGFGSILPGLPGGFNTTAQQQAIFDHLVRSIPSCALLVNTPTALDCLRSADFRQLNASIAQTFQQSWVPVLDGTILPDFSANMMSQGKFARVPLLVGTNSDEGAGMGPFAGAVNTDDDFRRAIQRFISPTAAENLHRAITAILGEALYLYPDIQNLGIPSLKTWPHVVRARDEYAKQGGQQLRRPVFAAQDGRGAGRGLVFALEGPRVAWDDWRTEGINWFMENDLGLVGS